MSPSRACSGLALHQRPGDGVVWAAVEPRQLPEEEPPAEERRQPSATASPAGGMAVYCQRRRERSTRAVSGGGVLFMSYLISLCNWTKFH